ncbi:hypothetical protein Lalb_Chr13g0303921 [Lupinus albus]|uniref:Uncharacterized protein n=1 Tax=Lupinus albus TaxID=3870 RepID=A0A6A4PKH0_LUPAL|nr:hypothetical protein Lalb_Chr13g0303921 [Lupinus albus]
MRANSYFLQKNWMYPFEYQFHLITFCYPCIPELHWNWYRLPFYYM